MTVAVVGLGKMGRLYAKLLAPVITIEDFPSELKPDYECLDAFLAARRPVELVVVATPTPTHYDIAIELLSVGYNILVEKPITLRAEQARELERIAAARGLMLIQSCLERYNPVIRRVVPLLSSEEVSHVVSHRFGVCPPSYPSGMARFDLGIHDLDLWRALFDREVPWTVNVGYRHEPRRTIDIYLKRGEVLRLDLLHRRIEGEAPFRLPPLGMERNPIVDLVQDVRHQRVRNEEWSELIQILESGTESTFTVSRSRNRASSLLPTIEGSWPGRILEENVREPLNKSLYVIG